jgi:hypothetical protein
MKQKEALSQSVLLSFPTKEVSQEKFRGTEKSPKSNQTVTHRQNSEGNSVEKLENRAG